LQRRNLASLENRILSKELPLIETPTTNSARENSLSKQCLSPKTIKLKLKLFSLKESLSQKEMSRTGIRSNVFWFVILLKLLFQISKNADNKSTLKQCKASPRKNSKTPSNIKLAGTISTTLQKSSILKTGEKRKLNEHI